MSDDEDLLEIDISFETKRPRKSSDYVPEVLSSTASLLASLSSQRNSESAKIHAELEKCIDQGGILALAKSMKREKVELDASQEDLPASLAVCLNNR